MELMTRAPTHSRMEPVIIMIGYSSYAVIVIRSTANPPMDQNSPEDVFALGSYLNREQYGDKPLLYGPAYGSELVYDNEGRAVKETGAPIYVRHEKVNPDEPDRYDHVGDKGSYKYAQNMLFPRMHSADHARDYEAWLGGVKGRDVTGAYPNGETYTVKMPEPEKPVHHPVAVVKPAGVPAPVDKPKRYGVKAPLPGVIVDVVVKPGDEIKRGDTVVILDAMKMENSITSDRAGKVAEVCVSPGESVMEGKDLVILE